MKKQLRKGWKTRVRLAVGDVISLTLAQGRAFNHRQHQMFREEIPGPAHRSRVVTGQIVGFSVLLDGRQGRRDQHW